jgi:hypothetical protein
VVAIFLVLTFLGLGPLAFDFVHRMHHAHADAHAVSVDAADSDAGEPDHPHRNDSDCELHRKLHEPAVAQASVPTLVSLGLGPRILTEIAARPVARRADHSIDCRGPPQRC